MLAPVGATACWLLRLGVGGLVTIAAAHVRVLSVVPLCCTLVCEMVLRVPCARCNVLLVPWPVYVVQWGTQCGKMYILLLVCRSVSLPVPLSLTMPPYSSA